MDVFKNILEHPKTSLEGLGWGAAVVAVAYYGLGQMHCDLTQVTGANTLPFLMGLIPVVRGALAEDRQKGVAANVSNPPPAAP